MVDFIKVTVKGCDTKQLLENEYLDFIGQHSTKTGEEMSKKEAKYKGMKFIMHDSGYVALQGSLHKYMNGGNHNYNDFSFIQLQEVLADITHKFNLDPNQCYLHNQETGVNIRPPTTSTEVLDGLLIHGTKKFRDISLNGGYVKKCYHCQYIIKVYDKRMQYNLKYENLRYELHFIRMEKLNKMGFYTLQDLTKIELFKGVRQLLLKEWDKVLLYEKPLNYDSLNKSTKENELYQWKDPEYWINLKRQIRCRQKSKYSEYVKKHTINRHTLIRNLIEEKIIKLIQC